MISTFPHEVLLNIFQFVPLPDRQLATSVCKIFNQIISDQVFEEERESFRTQKAFPEKLIEAVGGFEKLKAMPEIDLNPHAKDPGGSHDYSGLPTLHDADTTYNIFNQKITQPIRGKSHPFLFFKIKAETPVIRVITPILLFKDESTSAWKVKTNSNENSSNPLLDADILYLRDLFSGNATCMRDFHAKSNSLHHQVCDVKVYRK